MKMPNSADEVVVRLYGGIGNQLFQYFHGMYVALTTGKEYKIDISWLNTDVKREPEILSLLNLEQSQLYKSKKLLRLITPIARRIPKLQNFLGIHFPKEPGFSRDLLDLEAKYLFGYYQSRIYYEACLEIEPKIANIWKFKSNNPEFIKYSDKFSSKDMVALHIRGTDYLKSNLYSQLKEDDYIEALKLVPLQAKIIVFTDDRLYVENNFPKLSQNLILGPENFSVLETLFLMSKFNYLVMANSTFSYWSGIINPFQKVIAPAYWFMDQTAPLEIYPTHWELFYETSSKKVAS